MRNLDREIGDEPFALAVRLGEGKRGPCGERREPGRTRGASGRVEITSSKSELGILSDACAVAGTGGGQRRRCDVMAVSQADRVFWILLIEVVSSPRPATFLTESGAGSLALRCFQRVGSSVTMQW